MPSGIQQESRIKPFLRAREPAVIEAVRAFDATGTSDKVGVFTVMRRWKNEFK